MQCFRCGKKLGGFLNEDGTTITIDGQGQICCEKCYIKTKKEYSQMKTCDDCAYFADGFCRRIKMNLSPVSMGINDYFVQAEKCVHFITIRDYEIKAISNKSELEEVTYKEIIKEKEVIVKVRCSYCHNLYNETLDKCPHCGGRA